LEKRSASAATKGAAVTAAPDAISKARFSGGLILKLRKRHGFSRLKFAKLLGISSLAVKLWETGKARPRAVNRERLVLLRQHSTASLKRLLAANKKVWEA
jgi:DNA-binding transcriptional regulator YiaG